MTLIIIIQLWALNSKGELDALDYIIRLAAYPILYGMYLGSLKFENWVALTVNKHPLLMTITDQHIKGVVLSTPPLRHKAAFSNINDVEKAIIEVVLAHHKENSKFHPSMYVAYRIDSYNGTLEEMVISALKKVGVIGFTHAVSAKNDEDMLVHAQNNQYLPTEE
jgi:hypothetical protein